MSDIPGRIRTGLVVLRLIGTPLIKLFEWSREQVQRGRARREANHGARQAERQARRDARQEARRKRRAERE